MVTENTLNSYQIPGDIPLKLQQAIIFIECRNFQAGGKLCSQLLNEDPQNALVYLYLSMAENAIADRNDLVRCPGISQNRSFKLAMKFADPELSQYLNNVVTIQQQAAAKNLDKQLRDEIAARIKKLKPYLEEKKMFEAAAEKRSANNRKI